MILFEEAGCLALDEFKEKKNRDKDNSKSKSKSKSRTREVDTSPSIKQHMSNHSITSQPVASNTQVKGYTPSFKMATESKPPISQSARMQNSPNPKQKKGI